MGDNRAMSETIGFDRILELDWLDFVAGRLVSSGDESVAFREAREAVAATTGGGASPHNATGKTMTVLARIWLKVAPETIGLRDRAAAALPGLSPDDRLAVHWAMCELAYPFFLDAAKTVGRTFEISDHVTLAGFRSRLSQRWGARGTIAPATQRILQMWSRWGVLRATPEGGTYGSLPRRSISTAAAIHVLPIRIFAEPNRTLDVDDLQRSADLFAFTLPDARASLAEVSSVQVNREGGTRWVARAWT